MKKKKKLAIICIGIFLVCAGMSKLEIIPCSPEESELKSGMYSSSSLEALSDSAYLHQIEVRIFDRVIRIETPNGWVETTFEMKKNLWGDYVMTLDEKHLNDTKLRFLIKEEGEIIALSDFTESKCKIKRNERFTIDIVEVLQDTV